MFSTLSRSSISSATVTPSLVTVGPPQDLSSTAFRPRGPSVDLTAAASFSTPARRDLRASTSKANSLTAIFDLQYGVLVLPKSREFVHGSASRHRWRTISNAGLASLPVQMLRRGCQIGHLT